MNFSRVIASYGRPSSSWCACAGDDVSAGHDLLGDGLVGDSHALHNASHAPESHGQALEGDWGWKGVVLLTSFLVLVVATWYLRHRDKDICMSDGEVWAAPGHWVRPINNMEHLFSTGASVNTLNTAQVLFLQSSQPITYDLVHQALTILTERVLVLQLAIVWRGWWPWFRRTNTITVPLSESIDDPMIVYRRDLNSNYQVSKGPLWRATLVHQPSPCAGTYEAVLVWTIHHAITDGTTNMVLSRDLLTIINALTTGKDTHTPKRGLVPPLVNGLLSTFDILPALSFISSSFYIGFCHLLSRGAAHYLPPPDCVPPGTTVFLHDFSKEVSTQLVSHCKKSGVRIHSCLLAAGCLAYLRTARQNKQSLKSMRVTHETAINMRRYYPASQQESLGTVSFITDLKHHVSEDEDFWALAKTVQEDLYTTLDKDQMPLRLARLGWMLSIIVPANRFLWWLGLPSITYAHFHCTNMGNLSKLLPTEYDGPIHISRIIRSTASELAGSCYTVVTQTLGGRLLLSLDTYNTKTTQQTAKDYLSHLTQILTDIASHGAPLKTLAGCVESNGHIKSNGDVKSNGHVKGNGHIKSNGIIINGNVTGSGNINSNGHINTSDHINSNNHTQFNGHVEGNGNVVSNGLTSNGHIPAQCNEHKHSLTQTSITTVSEPRHLITNKNCTTLNYNSAITLDHNTTAQPITPLTNTNDNLASTTVHHDSSGIESSISPNSF